MPSLQEALDSKKDLWGIAAINEPNGPSYDFFENLLPPLRYVNAAFHHYPIVLSAPNAPVKARFVSNGSSVNARAGLNTWHESGTPVNFKIGGEVFGENLQRLHGPVFQKGYLPIVQMTYTQDNATYEQESFAAIDEPLSAHGTVFVRFKLQNGTPRTISAGIESKSPLVISNFTVRNTNGEVLVSFSKGWIWDGNEQRLIATVSKQAPAVLAIATAPFAGLTEVSPSVYEAQKKKCAKSWQTRLDSGMRLEVPERVVNQAWRSLIAQNHALVNGDQARYSSGNAYDRLYQAECGDVVRAFLVAGFSDTKRMIPSLLNYSRDKLEFHNAGFKLQLFAHFYWLTRDKVFLKSMRGQLDKEAKRIVETREQDSGLPPREKYCGDIETKVYSLHASAAGWRGLRDFSSVLADADEPLEAEKLRNIAKEFRQKIWTAMDKSIFTNTQPPFIPIALFGEEKPHDPLTATMLGSYWNLMAPYVLGSKVFGHGSLRERAMLDYLQEKGGVFMGLIRFDQHSGLFANENAVDDLYGLRYVTTLLNLDEVDRALVSFYGKLAQGMTRDTFIGAEGTGLKPLDPFGRPMYLPPNSTANAHFLSTLRNLLIQDFDSNDDGEPETLRLLFATPKRWLEDGKEIIIERAPTAFGEVSIHVRSRHKKGEVAAEILTPSRNVPEKMLMRIRVPDGWKIVSAKAGSRIIEVDANGTMDLSQMTGKVSVRLKVKKL